MMIEMMPPFVDPREFPAFDDQSSYSFSFDGQFDSSFSSSATSYDNCYTPCSRDSYGIGDLDRQSSSITSLGSDGPNSLADSAMFYTLTSTNNMAKTEDDNKSHSFQYPCHKPLPEHSIINYDFSQAKSMYGSLDLQEDFDGLPDIMLEKLPGLLIHDTKSPLPMTSSPEKFVVPSQTFTSEPYRPTTPNNMSRAVLAPPLGDYSSPDEPIKYFMSPRESQFQTPSSGISSSPHSTPEGAPLSQTLESSAALHRIQSMGSSRVSSSRVSKQPKRSPPTTSRIERITAGLFRCKTVGCKSEHGFKRLEHLKRHQRIHEVSKPLHCPFCVKVFQLYRRDNYKEHVRLHTRDKKGARTVYHPDAQALYDVLDTSPRLREGGRRAQ